MFSSALGRVLLATVLVTMAAGLVTGCGKQGDPLPPLRSVPQTTTDLSIRQQGSVLRLDMTYPATTSSGMALGGIEALELFQMVVPAPDGQVPEIDANAFGSAAVSLLTLRGADLGATVTGDQIEIQLPLEQPLPAEPHALLFAVRSHKAQETSAMSNRVAIVPIAPPAPPRGLTAEAGPNGVRLAWDIDGDDPEAFEIFRRQARNRGYGDPLAQVAGSTRTFVDQGARFGQRYIYTVRTLASKTPPILSAEAGEREIDYQDRFAPPLPANFVALGERNRVRLRSDTSPAGDVAGYILYRREPGREFHRLLEDPVTGTEYLDGGLAAGLSYDYRIQVVDELGNESELSAPLSATVR